MLRAAMLASILLASIVLSVPAAYAAETAPASTARSILVISSDGPKLRVTIDGKAYGKFTSKSVTVPDVGPGKHDVKIDWINSTLTKRTVYDGKLAVAPGVEMRIRAVHEGIQVTDQVALAVKAAPAPAPAPVGAPIKDFANAPSIVHVTSDKNMMMLLVDGVAVQSCASPKACDVIDVAPGNHEFDVRGGAFGNKPIFKGIVKITGGAEVWAKAADNEFKVYNTQARALDQTTIVVAQPAQGNVVAVGGSTTTTTTTVSGAQPVGGVSIGMSFVDPETGEVVSMGVSAGGVGVVGAGGGTVSHSQTTTTVVSGGNTVAVNQPATTTVVTTGGGNGQIEFTSEDGEAFLVFIDGKKVAQFVGMDGQSVVVKGVKPGEHKLVIKSFPLGDEVWTQGRLYMDPGFALKMGVGEQSGLEAFNKANAWEASR